MSKHSGINSGFEVEIGGQFMTPAQFHAARLPLAPAPTSPDDERITAWDRIASHPFFQDCYDSNAPMIDAMLGKLGESPTTVEWGASTPWGEDAVKDAEVANRMVVNMQKAGHISAHVIQRRVTPWIAVTS